MATSPDYITYVCDQLAGFQPLRYRKMFGEYMVYADDKPVLLVCDDTVFVKILPELETLMQNAEKGFPYDGAKEHYILDIENRDLAREVTELLAKITPLPKKRVKK